MECRSAEAAVLFGSLPPRLFDATREIVDAAILEGVSSLPFVPDDSSEDNGADVSSGKEKLIAILRREYAANLDTAELHVGRNLFALPPSYGKKKRAWVVRVFLEGGKTASEDAEADKENATQSSRGSRGEGWPDAPVNGAAVPPVPRSKDVIPKPSEIQLVEAETEQLRAKLRSSRGVRARLLARLDRMGQGHRAACAVKRTLDGCTSSGDGGVSELVATVIVGKERLESLKDKAGELSQRLDEEKEGREEDDKKVVPSLVAKPPCKPPPKPVAIKDDYDQRKKDIENDFIGPAAVSALLQKKRKTKQV